MNLMQEHPLGKHLFSFAVISDTHLNEDEFSTDSPFDVNRLANRRLRYVIQDLNSREISHVIHLGDIVHPVPSKKDLYSNAAECFFQQTRYLKHPIRIIPGNHDVGDKPMSWSPASGVRQAYLDAWSEHFGDHYFDFQHRGVKFIGMNSQLFDSGLPLESQQRQWLSNIFENMAESRVYMFMHYPPFLLDENENEHYDNLGSQSRRDLLQLIEENSVEALFAGHVHHFWYNRYRNCDCYLLPSTAFTRQDYSELFRIPPRAAFGRDDRSKLGYLLVHVYEHGHDFEFIRCCGRELESDHFSAEAPDLQLHPVNPRSSRLSVMGFDLRHDWCEHVQIPPTGGLDEFDRKTVRNDYPLLSLWEMGANRLRIPISDLCDELRLKRLHDLAHLGFKFTLFSSVYEDPGFLEILMQNAHLFEGWEIAGGSDKVLQLNGKFLDEIRKSKLRLFFSPLRSKSDIIASVGTYYHVINHGFSFLDFEQNNFDKLKCINSVFDGIVIRCGMTDSVLQTLEFASRVRQSTNLQTSVHLRLSADNPAQYQQNETHVCNRLVNALFHAWRLNVEPIFCDTLVDNDRGYFPRIGLVDREYNPRKGAKIVKNLHSLMHAFGTVKASDSSVDDDGIKRLSCDTEFGSATALTFPQNVSFYDVKTAGVITDDEKWLDWESGKLLPEPTPFDGFPVVSVASKHLRNRFEF